MVELTDRQKDILIRTALGEARGEGVEGMADVIQVIFNRAQSGQYPSDPAAVATQPYQFSTWNRGEGGNNPQQFKPSDPIYRKAEQALEAVTSGSRPDYTGGALFYHTPAVNPNWSGEVNRFGTIQRNGHIFYPSRPVPPAEIPNVVASQLDTTPQTRNVPRPQPRPDQRMIQGTSERPTSAASRAFPVMDATPRLAPAQDGIFAYNPTDMNPAQIAGGIGSATPDFFQPQVRLPGLQPSNIGTTRNVAFPRIDPRVPNRMDLASLIPNNVMRQELQMQGQSYAAQEAARRSGVGLPPATRVVPSVPIPGPSAPPKTQDRLAANVYPAAPMGNSVATALAITPRVKGFPTPVQQRPVAVAGFPTANTLRPTGMMTQPLRVTVNRAGSYTAPVKTREQQIAEVLARSRGPSAFGGGGTIDGAVQPVGTLMGRR